MPAFGAARRFTLEAARSGRRFVVEPGHTMLDVLLNAGIGVPHACRGGTCGACETRVLAGEPDHRDRVLSRLQRASNGVVIICCSGALSERLVLDV